jgi:MFS family permease
MAPSRRRREPPAPADAASPNAADSSWLKALLANRDFRLLFAGRCVSLLGDGLFLVALAWQTYTLSGAPTALALLGIAMSVPLILLLLLGGVVSDRCERRRVMLLADLLRAALLLLLGALAVSGTLRLWHMVVIVAIYGGAQAFFDPASEAIVPELLPPSQLGPANALDQLSRPLALRLAGPALGGLFLGLLGPGAAFLLDAATFMVSAATLWLMSSRSAPSHQLAAAVVGGGLSSSAEVGLSGSAAGGSSGPADGGLLSSEMAVEVREGWSYVRRHVWLWGTFASAGIAYLLFMGPTEVLLPFMVKHVLHGSGTQLGIVLGAGGLGSLACALVMGRSGLPSRSIAFIYLVWTLATLAVAGYGLATAIWQLMLASLAFNLLETAGTIVWATLKQRHVPGELLGRVSALDWLVSIGLLPVSLALTGPLSAALGVRTTLIAAGLAGAAATLGGLLLPGMRAVDRRMASVGSIAGRAASHAGPA